MAVCIALLTALFSSESRAQDEGKPDTKAGALLMEVVRASVVYTPGTMTNRPCSISMPYPPKLAYEEALRIVAERRKLRLGELKDSIAAYLKRVDAGVVDGLVPEALSEFVEGKYDDLIIGLTTTLEFAKPSEKADMLVLLACAQYQRGNILRAQKNAAAAVDCLDKASDPLRWCAAVHLDACLLEALGQWVKAEERLLAIIAIREQHPTLQLVQDSVVFRQLGRLPSRKDRLMECTIYLDAARLIDEERYGYEHPETARSRFELGKHRLFFGDLEDARKSAEIALAIDYRKLGKDHPLIAQDCHLLAEIYEKKGDLEKALQFSRSAVDVGRKHFEAGHPLVFSHELQLLRLLHHSQLDDEANALHREIGATVKQAGEKYPASQREFLSLAASGLAANKPKDSEGILVMLINQETKSGMEHPRLAGRFYELGVSLLEWKRPEEAVYCLRRALQVGEKCYGKMHTHFLSHHLYLFDAYCKLGVFSEAEACILRMIRIEEACNGANTPRAAHYYRMLGKAMAEAGRVVDAEKYLGLTLRIDALLEKQKSEYADLSATRDLYRESYRTLCKTTGQALSKVDEAERCWKVETGTVTWPERSDAPSNQSSQGALLALEEAIQGIPPEGLKLNPTIVTDPLDWVLERLEKPTSR